MTSRLETRLTLRPGQPGTRKLQARFGERLVAVRYRYDPERGQRMKTVELVIDSRPWEPVMRSARRAAGDIVQVRLHWNESTLRARAIEQGARWCPGPKRWEMTWSAARKLGLADRVEGSRRNQLAEAVAGFGPASGNS